MIHSGAQLTAPLVQLSSANYLDPGRKVSLAAGASGKTFSIFSGQRSDASIYLNDAAITELGDPVIRGTVVAPVLLSDFTWEKLEASAHATNRAAAGDAPRRDSTGPRRRVSIAAQTRVRF